MMLNFKKKILICLGLGSVLLLGDIASASCTITPIRDFTINLSLRNATTSSVPRMTIECTTDTVMTPRTRQSPEWDTFITQIQYNQKHPTEDTLLPRDKIHATFSARLAKEGGPVFVTWEFDMAKSIITTDTTTATLLANVKYTYTVDRVRGLVEPYPNNTAALYAGSPPRVSAYMDFSNDWITLTVSGATGGGNTTPPEPPTCTASAFTVMVPATVDFKILDAKALEVGKKYAEPFEITISRNRTANCKKTTIPSINMVAMSGELMPSLTEVRLADRGLIVSIYQKRTQKYIMFGRANDLQNQVDYEPITEQYIGYIEKDSNMKVQPGKFILPFSYRISYR